MYNTMRSILAPNPAATGSRLGSRHFQEFFILEIFDVTDVNTACRVDSEKLNKVDPTQLGGGRLVRQKKKEVTK